MAACAPLPHPLGNSLPRYLVTLFAQLTSDAWAAIRAPALLVDGFNLQVEYFVVALSIGLGAIVRCIVAAGRDLQHSTHAANRKPFSAMNANFTASLSLRTWLQLYVALPNAWGVFARRALTRNRRLEQVGRRFSAFRASVKAKIRQVVLCRSAGIDIEG